MGVRVGLHLGAEVGAIDGSGGPEDEGMYVAALVIVVGASEVGVALSVGTMVRVGTTLVGLRVYVGAYDGMQDNVIVGVSVGGFDGAVDGEQIGIKLGV